MIEPKKRTKKTAKEFIFPVTNTPKYTDIK